MTDMAREVEVMEEGSRHEEKELSLHKLMLGKQVGRHAQTKGFGKTTSNNVHDTRYDPQ